MKKLLLIFFTFASLPFAMFADKKVDLAPTEVDSTSLTALTGIVKDKLHGDVIPEAKIELLGTKLVAFSTPEGEYMFRNVPIGRYHLYISADGYQPTTEHVFLERGKVIDFNIQLRPDAINLNQAVVTGSRLKENRSHSCCLVGVVNSVTLDKVQAADVAQGLKFQPGVRVEDNCQNCGFSQVRINGLEGPYSQILIDSRPIFSPLAGVYGLEQIPANMIDRVEVLRGGGSALYGASAIAGTINIITKEPKHNSAMVSHEINAINGFSSFENLTRFNASFVNETHNLGLAVYGQNRHRSAYDDNGDGFSEMPFLDGRNLGLRTYYKPISNLRLSLEYGVSNEHRRGGDLVHEQPQNALVAEQLDHMNQHGNVDITFWSKNGHHRVNAYGAFMKVNRDSYYGGGDHKANKLLDKLKEGNLTSAERDELTGELDNRMRSFGRTLGDTYIFGSQYNGHMDHLLFLPATFTFGMEYMHDKLDDKSGYRPKYLNQSVNTKGAYVQNEWSNDKFGLVIGTRLDKHSLLSHAVVSPRANLRYKPFADLTFRAGYSRGFRAPQIFDEDLHVDNAGGDLIISSNSDDLKEEISNSFTLSGDWYHSFGNWQLNLVCDGFYTALSDAFDFEESDKVGYKEKKRVNTSGAKVMGVNVESKIAYGDLVTFQGGLTCQKSQWNDKRQWYENDSYATRRIYRTPDVYGYFVATYNPTHDLSLSLTGNFTGKMLVSHEIPTEDDGSLSTFNGKPAADIHTDRLKHGENQTATTYGPRTFESPSFFELGFKVAYDFTISKSKLQAFAGVKNIFDAYQDDFDRGPGRDSGYIYGPMSPRSFFAGLKLSL